MKNNQISKKDALNALKALSNNSDSHNNENLGDYIRGWFMDDNKEENDNTENNDSRNDIKDQNESYKHFF